VTTVFKPSGGQYLWLRFPGGNECADKLFAEALKHNILLAPGTMFNGSGRHTDCMRFAFSMDWTREVEQAIETVGALAKAL
jgi:DNA-binding transcriptional MocR family regulator